MLLTSGGSLVTLSSNYSLKDNIHVTIDFMKLVTIIITVVVIVVVSAIIWNWNMIKMSICCVSCYILPVAVSFVVEKSDR